MLTIYWKRSSEIESEPNFSAYKKEGEIRTYIGSPVAGGRKFSIPDNEENQALIDALDGEKWSKSKPVSKEVKKEIEEITKPAKAKGKGRK